MRLELPSRLGQIHKLFYCMPLPTFQFLLPLNSLYILPKTEKSIPLTQCIQELSEEMEENASKMLEEGRQKYVYYNIKIKTVSLNGCPPEKIIEFANNGKVDLIVIRNIGLSGLSKVKALGSVSRNVSEKASCPVPIVH